MGSLENSSLQRKAKLQALKEKAKAKEGKVGKSANAFLWEERTEPSQNG